MGKDFGFERAAELIEQTHARGPRLPSLAHVAEAAPTETEKQIRRAHGQTCQNCMGRTTACPENNPDCRFSPARTAKEIIGNVQAYYDWVKDHQRR